jgi:hypothetical protein
MSSLTAADLFVQIIIPMTLWLWDFADYRKGSITKKLIWSFHVLMILIGLLYVALTELHIASLR